MSTQNAAPESDVIPLLAVDRNSVVQLLAKLGMELSIVDQGAEIPGSFWGESEAGLVGNVLYARSDTPVHSVLHESCHFACMDDGRKQHLHTDAGGDYAEEDAVCYLQIVLAEQIKGYDSTKCRKDMDAWGYTFRLGSAHAWFENDASDAREWLESRELLPHLAQI